MGRKILSVFMAIAVAVSLSACQTEDTGQETQTSEFVATTVSGTLQISETTISQSTKTSNMIVDKEVGILYYFFKDGETVDLSLIENWNHINCIKIIPLESDYRFEKIIDIKEEQNTDKVTEIFISGGILNDVSFLNSFENLQYISFDSCNLNNTSAIGEITSAISFIATDCKIDNIDFLSSMSKLETICFENTPIEYIPNLVLDEKDDFHSISLYFVNCGEIDICGLSGLADYKGLIYKIDLSESIVKDFSPLSLIYVDKFDLSNTYGSNYSTMKGLKAGTVWLEGNKIYDIGFLEGNTVNTLFLNDNNIADWSPLLNVEELVWCWTFNNPIIMPDNKEQFANKGIQIADSNQYAYPY